MKKVLVSIKNELLSEAVIRTIKECGEFVVDRISPDSAKRITQPFDLMDADIYLMDEPFKSLDGEIKQSVASFLHGFFTDKTVLIISHDKEEAELMNASVYWMSDGKIQRKTEAFFDKWHNK